MVLVRGFLISWERAHRPRIPGNNELQFYIGRVIRLPTRESSPLSLRPSRNTSH